MCPPVLLTFLKVFTIPLFQEFFSIDSGGHVPEIEGPLYLKSEGKKAWKRFYCVLRASGIYYNPKGKSKVKKQCNTLYIMPLSMRIRI